MASAFAQGLTSNPEGPEVVHLRVSFTKEYDGDSGLVYMFQRWYSAETGTFMSEAPYPQWREHSYIAFAINPIQASDPLGLELVPIAPGDVPSDTPVPPDYDPDTWQPFRNPKLGVPPGREIEFKDPSGNRWCPHPEDGDHYPYWGVRRKGSKKWINIPSRPGDPILKPDPAPYWGPTGKDLLPLLLIPPLLTPVPGDEVIIYGAIRCLA